MSYESEEQTAQRRALITLLHGLENELNRRTQKIAQTAHLITSFQRAESLDLTQLRMSIDRLTQDAHTFANDLAINLHGHHLHE